MEPVMSTIATRPTAPHIEDELCTAVLSMRYHFRTRVGVLCLPPGCCTNMTAAINCFTRIDPEVVQIQIFAGAIRDTVYDRQAGGWRSYPLRSSAERLKDFRL
jgi:hypothetical protein